MAKDNIFKYDYRQYGRDTGLSDKQIREEYSRLRDIAQKRIKRLSTSEFDTTETYLQHKGGFPKVKDIHAKDMKNALSDVYRFLHAQTGSVSGLKHQRTEALKTLNENGFDFVNKRNFTQFYNFMNYVKEKYQSQYAKNSDQNASLFDELAARGISVQTVKRDFEFWINHLDELQSLPMLKREKGKKATADMYRKLLEPKETEST